MASSFQGRGMRFRAPRRAERTSVLLPASVVTMRAYQFPELLNISATGAKFRGGVMPTLGATCMFRLDEVKLLCKVVWSTEAQYGVRFEEPIAPSSLEKIRQSGSIAAIGMMTPDEKLAEETWSGGDPD